MKKAIFAPVLGVLAIALWSFTPAPTANRIIRTDNGLAIIPSAVEMQEEDQIALLQELQSCGSDYGYILYTDASGTTRQYGNAVSVETLKEIDSEYGTDLRDCKAYQGVVLDKMNLQNKLICESTQNDDYVPDWDIKKANINNILSRYE